MTRQPTNPKPYQKQMESYNNFSGGLNSVTSNDNLKNSEFPELSNMDLGERGSLKRRTGTVLHLIPQETTTKWSDIGGKKWSEL